MLMMSFYDALTRANFSFVYFLQFYLLKIFDIFQWEGFEPTKPPSGYASGIDRDAVSVEDSGGPTEPSDGGPDPKGKEQF